MSKHPIDDFISGLEIEEIKEVIFSLVDQYFPVMVASERQNFILKLLGKSGDDKLSSMVNR
jgi:hypothetical protein